MTYWSYLNKVLTQRERERESIKIKNKKKENMRVRKRCAIKPWITSVKMNGNGVKSNLNQETNSFTNFQNHQPEKQRCPASAIQ